MPDARKSAKQDAIGRRTADARTTRQELEMIVGVPVLCWLNLSTLLPKKGLLSCNLHRAIPRSSRFLRVVTVFYSAVLNRVPRLEEGRRCRAKAYTGRTVADTRTDRAVRRVYANLFFSCSKLPPVNAAHFRFLVSFLLSLAHSQFSILALRADADATDREESMRACTRVRKIRKRDKYIAKKKKSAFTPKRRSTPKIYRNPRRFRFSLSLISRVSILAMCHPRILTLSKHQLLVHVASLIHPLLPHRTNIATVETLKREGCGRAERRSADTRSSRPEIRNSHRNPFFIARSISATVLEKPSTTTTATTATRRG